MPNRNKRRTFEHRGHTIYVYAFHAITDCWTIQVAVVGNGEQTGAWAKHVAWNQDSFCEGADDALDTGAELARAYIDSLCALPA